MVLLMASAATTSFPIITLQQSSYSSAKCTKLDGALKKIKALKSKHACCSSTGFHVKTTNNNFQAPTNPNGKNVPTSENMLNKEEFIEDINATFREKFYIRSYEVDPDRTASIETLMNFLQETGLNWSRKSGLLGDGFGYCTPKMQKRNLIWVFLRMHIVVDRYPMWGDVVQVDYLVSEWKKNAFRFDWVMRDCQTGEILTRASCVSIMMNKVTRRLCRVPEEVREELKYHLVNTAPILELDNTQLPLLDHYTAHYISSGLRATRNDLDVNYHVNNVKYAGWILNSVPESMSSSSHEVAAMTLEYKRECGRDSKLQSLTSIISDDDDSDDEANSNGHIIECHHLLRLENGVEVVRGRTLWRPKLVGTREF